MQISSVRLRLNQGDAIIEFTDGNGLFTYQSVNLQELANYLNDLINIGAGEGEVESIYSETNNEFTFDKNGSNNGFTIQFDLNGSPFVQATQVLTANPTNVKSLLDSVVVMKEGEDTVSQITFKVPKLAHGTLLTDYSITPTGAATIGAINQSSVGGNWLAVLTGIELNGADTIIHVVALP